MNKHRQRIIGQPFAFTRCLISYFLGLMIAWAVGKIPSEVRLPIIPVNPLVLAVLFTTGIMLWKLLPSFRNYENTLVVAIVMVVTYTIIICLIAVDTPEMITFNIQIMSCLTIPVYTIAVLPFLMKQAAISFQRDKAERDSTFFAASIMWLSPFLAEMLIMLKWYTWGNLGHRLTYMVLGGKGTNDVLFFYGFWLFISVEFFHLLAGLTSSRTEKDGVCARYRHRCPM